MATRARYQKRRRAQGFVSVCGWRTDDFCHSRTVARGDRSPYERRLWRTTEKLRRATDNLAFGAPVSFVYNPLGYASRTHRDYLRQYGSAPKRVIFLGMNPGPFGMAQTGVPFGEVKVVQQWLGISGPVRSPRQEHPARPVHGFACQRREVSGARLWGLFRERFGTPARFFRDHFVANFCPLVFMEESGRNLTPDKLPAAERDPLLSVCRNALAEFLELWQPEWVIGVGRFAQREATVAIALRSGLSGIRVGTILHPSPASPQANRDWAGTATAQLQALGIW